MRKCKNVTYNSKLYTNKTQILFLYMEYSLHQNYLDQCYIGGDLEIKKKNKEERTIEQWESGNWNKHQTLKQTSSSRQSYCQVM